MKILSVAVPCYNSQEYMRKCVDSLLKGGEDVEILIVDDGSKDDTLKIARDYEEKYPTIVKAIHQENKGHGGAVNTGLAHATGLYFKVVDRTISVVRINEPVRIPLCFCRFLQVWIAEKAATELYT